MRISKDSIAVVRNAAREHERAHSVLEAQATQIEFDLLSDAVGQVELDGATVPLSRKSISVVEATELTIAGIGRISVRPAIRDKNKLLKSLETAKDHLRAALADADCDDLSEAERQWAEQEILERDLGTARAELARLVPGDPKVGLAAGIGPLRAHVDVLRLRLREEWAALGMDVLPTAAQAAADARAAEDEDIAGAEALAQARAELDASNERRGEARQALARADGAAEAAEAERVRLCAEADRAAAREPDDALTARLADAETKRAHCSAALTELERDRPLDTPEGMQARIERYERSLSRATANRPAAARRDCGPPGAYHPRGRSRLGRADRRRGARTRGTRAGAGSLPARDAGFDSYYWRHCRQPSARQRSAISRRSYGG